MGKTGAPLLNLGVVGTIFLVLITGCVSDRSADDLGTELSESLSSLATRTDPLPLEEVADFEWVRVVFVCPYETKTDIEKRLGFSWDDFPGELDDEGRSLFVFAEDDEVAEWASVSRAIADPCAEETPQVVEREAARFTVDESPPNGSPALRHQP